MGREASLADLSLAKLSWQAQLGVFAFLALAGVGIYYYLYEMPIQETIATKTAELGTMRARIAQGVQTAKQLGEFRREVGDLEARLDGLRQILPQEKDVADLLRRIQTLATQSNLTIRGFKPEAIKTHELHAEWPIGLELEGTYHNLGVFLDRVSKFPRIINIGSIGIDTKPQPTPNASIDVSCIATTFVLLETQTAKPETPATGSSQ
jgi:type IV pilus assembly protein PilO